MITILLISKRLVLYFLFKISNQDDEILTYCTAIILSLL